VPISGVDLSV